MKWKKIVGLLLLVSLPAILTAQNHERPRLVVGVVVDQMRSDYINRYWENFGDDGFKRLLGEGFECRNQHFSYMPTYTGPGHAAVYTGTTPAINGIIANNWYNRTLDETMYCVSDSSVNGVGVEGGDGKMSPRNLLTSGIADELQLTIGNESKVMGVSLKDRAAILPAGHTADAAYWVVDGQFVSSSYYMDELPSWVNKFNRGNRLENYLSEGWHLLKDREDYITQLPDDNPYEGVMDGKNAPVFPYALDQLKSDNSGNDIIKGTPMGNSLTLDFALEGLRAEKLGVDAVTDFLAISFSGTDYVGHRFGTYALETEDTYLRLDQTIARLLNVLDNRVGQGNYLLFLTADHGAQNPPSEMEDIGIPADYQHDDRFIDRMGEYLKRKTGVGSGVISSFSNMEMFLNEDTLKARDLSREEMAAAIVDFVRHHSKEYYDAIRADDLLGMDVQNRPYKQLYRGYNPNRSGDILLIPRVGWMDYSHTGTTHNTPWAHDTHVPLLWFGWHVKHGQTVKLTNTRDIAPTLATMLRISWPNGTTGKPIKSLFDH